MPVHVGVRLASIRGLVRMLVMLVMDVDVRVFQRFMCVLVLMPLAEVQPHPYRHQRHCYPEERCRRFAQYGQREGGAEERCH